MATQEKVTQLNNIDDALHVLEMASKDKAAEVGKLIRKEYSNLSGILREAESPSKVFNDLTKESMRWYENARDKIAQASKQTALKVDASAKQNPWTFVGAAALAGGVLGYMVKTRFASACSQKE